MNKSEQREKFSSVLSASVVKCSERLDNSVCSEVNGRRKWISLEAISAHFQDLQLHKNLQSLVNPPPPLIADSNRKATLHLSESGGMESELFPKYFEGVVLDF